MTAPETLAPTLLRQIINLNGTMQTRPIDAFASAALRRQAISLKSSNIADYWMVMTLIAAGEVDRDGVLSCYKNALSLSKEEVNWTNVAAALFLVGLLEESLETSANVFARYPSGLEAARTECNVAFDCGFFQRSKVAAERLLKMGKAPTRIDGSKLIEVLHSRGATEADFFSVVSISRKYFVDQKLAIRAQTFGFLRGDETCGARLRVEFHANESLETCLEIEDGLIDCLIQAAIPIERNDIVTVSVTPQKSLKNEHHDQATA